MVDFAGWELPVLYQGQSHIESHNWVRSKAGLFDVSHMVQHIFRGGDAARLLSAVTPTDLAKIKPFTSTLSVLLNDEGGIVDDTIISKHSEDEFYVVTNAARREVDLEFFKSEAEKRGLQVEHAVIEAGGLLALQGPSAAEVLQKFTDFNLNHLGFGECAFVNLPGGKYHVARVGYTGEDGFEISIPNPSYAEAFAEALLHHDAVKPIGLAARDSLRLEAGMCLYGHDLTEKTSPIEARLAWVVAKSRREPGAFNGAARIISELAAKQCKLRTGLVSKGPAPREGTKVFHQNDCVGTITSGSFSPTTSQNVAMAYLPREYSRPGIELEVEIRGKRRPAQTHKMPFVEPRYYRKS